MYIGEVSTYDFVFHKDTELMNSSEDVFQLSRNLILKESVSTINKLLASALLTSDDICSGKIIISGRQVSSLFLRKLSLVLRKLVFGVSDLVRHKPGCTATEDG